VFKAVVFRADDACCRLRGQRAAVLSELVEEERSMVMDRVGDVVRSLALVTGIASAGAAFAADEQVDRQPETSGAGELMPWEVDEATTETQHDQSEGTRDEGLVSAIPVDELRQAAEPEPERPPARQRGPAVEEIVVTARKREESLQDVPLAVTAFSAGEMERRGFSGLDDIAAATPGFTFEGFLTGGAHGNPVIRGLSQQFTTARIQNVSFFLDGVYLQRQSMLNLSLIDMQRVEVLKGPQNALYGRSAFAGAVNYVTLEPSADAQGYLLAGGGDNERQDIRVSLSGPLNRNATVLGKVTAGLARYDGHTRNDHPVANANPPGPNLRGNLGGHDDQIYSVSLAYLPDWGLNLRASYYHSSIERETGPGYSISGVNAARFGLRFDDQNDLNCNRVTVQAVGDPTKTHTGFSAYCGELPRYASDIVPRTKPGIIVDPRALGTISKTDALTINAQLPLMSELTLNYLFGYARHSALTDGGVSDEDPLAGRGIVTNALITLVDTQNPEGYTFANTASGRPNTNLRTFSNELRFDWLPTDQLRTSFGVYYSHVEDEEWTTLFISDLCNDETPENIANCNTPLSAPNTLAERTVLTAGPAYDQYTRQHGGKVRSEWSEFEDDIYSIFASVTYEFLPGLDATLEGRYNREEKRVRRLTDAFALAPGETVTYTFPFDPVLPLLGNSISSSIAVPEDAETFTSFTPRAIVNWAYADDRMVYASAAKGVKAGGFNNAMSEEELRYVEEENWTYELGTKNRLFDRRMTLNASIYYVDQTTMQGGVPPSHSSLSGSDIIANIGGATSVGVEIESSFLITDTLSVDVGLTFSDPTYKNGTKFSGGRADRSGVRCDGVTCPSDGDISGNQLSRSSREQYSLGINFASELFGWSINSRVDSNYQSRQYVEPLNLAWVPSRIITNASFGLVSPEQQWEINGWGKNLTGEDYAGNAFFIGVFNQYMVGKGAGRTFGAALKYNF
jgi:iron complex outermembrane recepter protein